MSNLVVRLKSRLAQCQLAVEAAYQVINRAERLAKKEKSVIPQHQMDLMMAEVKFCKDAVHSVEASLAGASKYPPLTFNRRQTDGI